MTNPKVPLGQIVVHPNAERAVEQCNQRIDEFLERHQMGDWGDVDEYTRQFNEEALRTGGPILSSFDTCGGDVLWVITEDGTTTVLLPI